MTHRLVSHRCRTAMFLLLHRALIPLSHRAQLHRCSLLAALVVVPVACLPVDRRPLYHQCRPHPTFSLAQCLRQLRVVSRPAPARHTSHLCSPAMHLAPHQAPSQRRSPRPCHQSVPQARPVIGLPAYQLIHHQSCHRQPLPWSLVFNRPPLPLYSQQQDRRIPNLAPHQRHLPVALHQAPHLQIFPHSFQAMSLPRCHRSLLAGCQVSNRAPVHLKHPL